MINSRCIIFVHRRFKVINTGIEKLAASVAILTATTESRAATANMSAQETTGRPHALSTSYLIWSTTSNPRAELLFGRANFSLSMVADGSRRIEPSQPWITKRIRWLLLTKEVHAWEKNSRYKTYLDNTLAHNRVFLYKGLVPHPPTFHKIILLQVLVHFHSMVTPLEKKIATKH